MTDVDRRTLLAAPLLPMLPRSALAGRLGEPQRVPLWPGTPAGLLDLGLAERVTQRSSDPALPDRAVDRIRDPRIEVFLPAQPNGAAMLIAPGGGYERVVVDKEGYELAAWLTARGIACFVLFYRLPREGWRDRADVALADAQRAMRLIRARAAQWRVDPARVGMMGFSAGGHLCADLAARHAAQVYAPVDAADAQDARPIVAAPIYPVVSMDAAVAHAGSRASLLGDAPTPALEAAHSPDRNVTAATPPCFLLHAEDDPVVKVANTLLLRAALRAAGVPVETHLFEEGGHGFGLRGIRGKPAEDWPALFLAWSRRRGLVGA